MLLSNFLTESVSAGLKTCLPVVKTASLACCQNVVSLGLQLMKKFNRNTLHYSTLILKFIRPFVHLSTNPSYLSLIHSSFYPFFHPTFNDSIFHPSSCHSSLPPTRTLVIPSINEPFFHPSLQPSIHPSISHSFQ